MYFTDISHRELVKFHNQVKVNFKIKLQDASNIDLFKVETIGDILKVYPLFYCDRIESSNSNDKIMENKCVICENKNDTILYFISDENLPVLNLNYTYYADFIDYLVFYMYDGINGNSLHNVTANCIFKENEEVTKELTFNSDYNGIIYIDTSKFTYDELTIDFNITGTIKRFEWRSEE